MTEPGGEIRMPSPEQLEELDSTENTPPATADTPAPPATEMSQNDPPIEPVIGAPVAENSADAPTAESPAENAERQQEQPQWFREMTGAGVAEARTFAQQSSTEPKMMAELFKSATEDAPVTPASIQEYFQHKQEQDDLFKFATAEELAQEILALETAIVGPFVEQLKTQLPNLTPEKCDRAIDAMRETVFALVMNNKMSAEVIQAFLEGNIVIQKQPGRELDGCSFPTTEIVSSCDIVNGRPVYYFYEKFFNDGKDGQSFNLLHEMAHGIARPGIWPVNVYNLFLIAAKSQSEADFNKLADYPELREVARIVGDPQSNSPLFRSYIQKRFQLMAEMPPEQQADERMAVAEEVLADYVTYFLRADSNTESFMRSRTQHIQSPEVMINFVTSKLGKTREEIMQEHGIDPTNITASELIDKLAAIPELGPLFGSAKAFSEAMNERFKNSGQNLETDIDEQTSGSYYDTGSGGAGGGSEHTPYNIHAGADEDLLTKFWGWATGKAT